MVTSQSIRKYLAPAAIATSIAVFSPIGMDNAFAHGGPDEATTEEANQQQAAEGNQEAKNNGVTIIENIGVGELQEKLQNAGQNLSLDGANGPETETALRNFQSNQGIAVDGIVGPATMNALNEGGSESSADSGAEATVNDGDVIGTAQNLVGAPYVMGGTTPDGFDSSGFVNYVFKQHGIELNRTHADMWANDGTKVDNPEPGDVVFFSDTYQNGVSHSGIYLGNNEMIHAGTEATGVEQTSMDIDYWSDRYIGAKRF